MPARIRLQRKGKKGQPFYQIVIADGRAPRDGKYIERIGTYNPLTTPAQININIDRAIDWLQKGATPTDTVRNLFSYKGIMLKNHLLIGVKKGAITESQAEAKFNTWIQEKQSKIENITKKKEINDRDISKARLDAEKKVNEARAEALAKKAAEEAAKKAAEEAKKAEEAAAAAAEANNATAPEQTDAHVDAPANDTPATEAPATEAPQA